MAFIHDYKACIILSILLLRSTRAYLAYNEPLFYVSQPSRSTLRHLSSTSPEPEPDYLHEIPILYRGDHCLVVSKPPAVVVHHSGWTGSRARAEVPILQRVRDQIGRRVNLVHRLDRGCSGCLLLTYADDPTTTAALVESMSNANKTYLALVRGEGVLRGRDFQQEGWFEVDRRIADEKGDVKDARTLFLFVAGQDNQHGMLERPRASIVLAKPKTGRWHQIRRHLNGLSHPILGDSTHGNSKENRQWKTRGMLSERTCLHLARFVLPPTAYTPDGLDVACPVAPDMVRMVEQHLPDLLPSAKAVLDEEGVVWS